ncbi:MAG TPA: DUF5018 domain-containing protein [Candidatus Paceibacterota bacterium]|jgi:hypothetical protein|nr:DUF5018 domain-containing protein [Candidatus Paceibacterota bacterium]
MRLQKIVLLFAFIIFSCFFIPKVFAVSELDVSVVGGNLLIDSCNSNLQPIMGYKGYVNDMEIFTTGPSGGYPCYARDLFFENIATFLASYPTPLALRFDFYSDPGFSSPVDASFTIYYDGSIFTTTPSTPPATTLSSEKAITSFSFQDLPTPVNGVIDETNHTIALTVPFDTDITDLRPTIDISSGATISPVNNIDFSNPVVYTVTAEDDSTEEYTVIVVVGALVRNPVIIIPGVLGTEISKGGDKLWLDLSRNLTDIGDQFMDSLEFNEDLTPSDLSLSLGNVIRKEVAKVGNVNFPLFDYSEHLIQEFQDQGYVEGTDIFLFPYDWRSGVNEGNVNQLKQKIADVIAETGASKVDSIAHSTGGLLLKKYVMENSMDNHIDKAVFVGVPNTGVPKAVKVLLQGDGFDIPFLSDGEIKKIAKNLPVIYDLLPSEQYFNSKGSYIKVIEQKLFGYTEKDLNFDEANTFLAVDHQLNVQALINSHHLHTADFDDYDMRTAGVDVYAINGCKAGTLGKVREVRSHSLFGDFTSYMVPEQIPGDGTVPLESSTNLPINESNKYYALKTTNHGKMLTADGIRQQIVNIISGSNLSAGDIITQNISECKLSGRAISVYSPLSIDVLDQDDNHAGLASDGVSIENNIPNADFEIFGEHKFIYLPTDEGQTYTINIAGTGTGVFTLTDTSINENDVTGMQVFENVSVTPSLLGNVNLSDNTSLDLDTNGDGTTDETLTPTASLNREEAENFVPNKEGDTNDNPLEDDSASNTNSGGDTIAKPSDPLPATPTDSTTPAQPPSEIIPAVKEEPAPEAGNDLENPKPKVENEKAEETQHLPQESSLTGSVADSNVPISYAIVIAVIGGALLISLLAKKFSKL